MSVYPGTGYRVKDAPMKTPHTMGQSHRWVLLAIMIIMVSGWCQSAAQADWLVLPPDPRVVNAGSVTTQGDAVIGANTVRTNYGVDGSGIKIGIISDSYNALGGAGAGVVSGDLPGGVTVLNDDFGVLSTDEGRKMAEIIHDVAPGAQILFHSAFNNDTTGNHINDTSGPYIGSPSTYQHNFPTQESIATAINDFVNLPASQRPNVIVCDAALLNEPFYQDGVVAQAVNNAKAAGVAFISSAGNAGNQSVQGPFTASPLNYAGQAIYQFGGPGSPTQQAMLEVSVPAGGTMTATLQWAAPYESRGGGASTVDYDLLAFDAGFLGPVASSTRDQHSPTSARQDNDFDGINDADPYEILVVKNTGGSTDKLNLLITLFTGIPDLDRPLKLIISGDATITDPTFTGSYTLVGSAAAEGSMAVGAQSYTLNGALGSAVEAFSALGGTEIYFDENGDLIAPIIRINPQLVGPDGVLTTIDPTFYGTSAAASHVAAAAALLLQRAAQLNTTLSVDDLYALLYSTATDLEAPGFDYKSGYGIINLRAALSALEVPEPATVMFLLVAGPLLLRRRRSA